STSTGFPTRPLRFVPRLTSTILPPPFPASTKQKNNACPIRGSPSRPARRGSRTERGGGRGDGADRTFGLLRNEGICTCSMRRWDALLGDLQRFYFPMPAGTCHPPSAS